MNAALTGKKIAVVGLGVSNISLIRYLIKHDVKKLTVYDTRENPPRMEELPRGIDFKLGPLNGKELGSYDMVVLSPGLSINLPEIVEAAALGAEVVGDIELFAREAKGRIIGITGSNGKSTVTSLMGYMATRAGLKTAVGANIGTPVFDILSDNVDVYVLELSSFELETTSSLKLEAGVILNVTEDHLDRYNGSLDEYAKAKQRIFLNCKTVITNRDDKRTFAPGMKDAGKCSFGLDSSCYGRIKEGREIYLCRNGKKLLAASQMQIKGVHNQLNALAAMALADALGLSPQEQADALRSFAGLRHRCQLVRKIGGISFYNDSKATNVASAEAAIRGLKDLHPEGLLLLAGGLGKGQDFTPLKQYLGREVKSMYCFGKDAQKLLDLSDTYCHKVLNMREALLAAYEKATLGQAILLSPACASFDQFKGFEDRGQIFVSMINHLTDKDASEDKH